MASNKVIELLTDALTVEISTIISYMDYHARVDDLGYPNLAEGFKSRALDEMKHAEKLQERLLRLGSKLEYKMPQLPKPTKDIKAMIKADIALEEQAIKMYNAGIKLCDTQGDGVTRQLLEEILQDEDGHLDELETLRDLLERHGEEYLLVKG